MAFKTPGVYVQEITTFPPSVVPVETAVPAFIGYTEKARDAQGDSLNLVPTRIKSLLEFEERFGGPFRPATYQVQVNTAAGNAVGSVTSMDAGDNAIRYYLYGCLRHFYANGGGACYVVSVGTYPTAPVYGNTTSGLRGGLERLAGLDEPTLLVFPDGVSLSETDLGSLQQAALGQCEKLQDRFMITDLRHGDQAISVSADPVATFRQRVGTRDLKYGAAYYPWVRTIYRPDVPFRRLTLVDMSDSEHPEATLDALTGDAGVDGLVPAARNANAQVAKVVDAVDVSGMFGSPITLDRDTFTALSDHFATLLELLRSAPAVQIRNRLHNLLRLPRAIALAFQTVDDDTVAPPVTSLPAELRQAVEELKNDSALVAQIVRLIALEKNEDVRKTIAADTAGGEDGRPPADVVSDYSALDESEWVGEVTVESITADATDFGDPETALRPPALAAAADLQAPFDQLAAAALSLFEAAEFLAGDAEKRLFSEHPVYKSIAELVQRVMSLLPASGAVTGVYAATDRTRGVWKAPANVSLADTAGPAVRLNDQDQAGLNVDTTGKSVNAIRAFAGKGTLVWGARTLAGNDNEWRYVPVRRFFNMAEESIKKATEPFVFEPNDANTWVRVRAMIENFLTVQWRQGALAGATPAEAFYVKVGLGETMTAQDVLEGRMIIEVGMAVVRPAEFIVLKFAHKMQVS